MTEFSKGFGDLYDFFMYLPDRFFLRARRARLLSELSGNILEVGCGTGLNFEHYGNNTKIIAIEPSSYMLSKARKRLKSITLPERFKLLNIGCGFPEIAELIQPGSLDSIVCTLVLCTIPEPAKAIMNFMKWLRPGGRLLILEHVKSHHQSTARFQNIINPTWQRISGGCQLNRPTDRMLSDMGFEIKRMNYFWLVMPFYEAEYIKPL